LRTLQLSVAALALASMCRADVVTFGAVMPNPFKEKGNVRLGALIIGTDGIGRLQINSGSVLTVLTNPVFGDKKNGDGTGTISGGMSSLNAKSTIVVGSMGTGMLNVEDGGNVTTGGPLLIGDVGKGAGTVTVSGMGSTVNVANSLVVGNGGGRGSFTAAGGSTVMVSKTAIIGERSAGAAAAGTAGTAKITSGATLTVADGLFIGAGAMGTLEIGARARVTAKNTTIGLTGDKQGGNGTVTVDEGTLTTTGNLTLGDVDSGGTLDLIKGTATVGGAATVRGSIKVSSGSTFSAESLRLFAGTVNVLGTGSNAMIAKGVRVDAGSLTVDGGGAMFTAGGDVTIAGDFLTAARLNVMVGGEVLGREKHAESWHRRGRGRSSRSAGRRLNAYGRNSEYWRGWRSLGWKGIAHDRQWRHSRCRG
jgi:T5SS/PEP-CTERM-associated repeat protein